MNFILVKRRVLNVGMVLGSQGSPDGSLEGFRGSPGEIWSAPGALWGMFGHHFGLKVGPRRSRFYRVLFASVEAGRRRMLGDEKWNQFA